MKNIPPEDNQAGQSFGVGLLVGSLAGIAAFYLFGTKEGQKLKQKLTSEFNIALENLPQSLPENLALNKAPATVKEPLVENKATSSTPTLITKIVEVIMPSESSKNDDSEAESPKDPDPKRYFRKSGRKLI